MKLKFYEGQTQPLKRATVPYHLINYNANLKGAGTRDLIWLKVVSLERSV